MKKPIEHWRNVDAEVYDVGPSNWTGAAQILHGEGITWESFEEKGDFLYYLDGSGKRLGCYHKDIKYLKIFKI